MLIFQTGWGLRAKTAAILLGIGSALVLLALLLGINIVDRVHQQFGTAFVQNQALLTQQRVLSVIGRELALAQRFAASPLLQKWAQNETKEDEKNLFFTEARSYTQGFADQNFFFANRASAHFFFADQQSQFQPTVRYTLSPNKTEDTWFYLSLKQTDPYNINIDFDRELRKTKVWTNVVVRNEQGESIGVIGTGFDFSRFLTAFVRNTTPGLTTMLLNTQGAIVAHPDPTKIELAAIRTPHTENSLFKLISNDTEREAVRKAFDQAREHPQQAFSLALPLQGRPHLVALAYIPELNWMVVSALDLAVSQIIDQNTLVHIAVGMAGFLLMVFVIATVGFDRLLLLPLARLSESAKALTAGRYDIRLHSRRHDEIGELTRTFDLMAQKINAHTQDLEQRVSARTADLAAANEAINEAHQKLTDSIRYASLIQSAILPDKDLAHLWQGEYFVLWQPRDVVGGDFYLYRANENGCLFGVIDCAGHGVPGAFMTMIAHAALEVATGDTAWNDPAALLARVDEIVRQMIPNENRFGQLATNMDMGLCYIDLRQRTACFAGAKLSLFWSDGDNCQEIRGGRRGVNDRKPGQFTNTCLPLPAGRTCYLISDGLFDQAGGEQGYGFGLPRFAEWVQNHTTLSLADQKSALLRTLEHYRGDHPQRDDITVLAFRFDDPH